MVSFKRKDYKDHKASKVRESSVNEFAHIILPHVLPTGFMKIRHYGFLANKGKDEQLEICRAPKALSLCFPNKHQNRFIIALVMELHVERQLSYHSGLL